MGEVHVLGRRGSGLGEEDTSRKGSNEEEVSRDGNRLMHQLVDV
jgi:hypothetical protein